MPACTPSRSGHDIHIDGPAAPEASDVRGSAAVGGVPGSGLDDGVTTRSLSSLSSRLAAREAEAAVLVRGAPKRATNALSSALSAHSVDALAGPLATSCRLDSGRKSLRRMRSGSALSSLLQKQSTP